MTVAELLEAISTLPPTMETKIALMNLPSLSVDGIVVENNSVIFSHHPQVTMTVDSRLIG